MNEAIWDSETGHQLAYVKDRQDVFRAADHKQIGTYQDGAVYDPDGKLVCHLGRLDHDPSSGPLPEAFKALLND